MSKRRSFLNESFFLKVSSTAHKIRDLNTIKMTVDFLHQAAYQVITSVTFTSILDGTPKSPALTLIGPLNTRSLTHTLQVDVSAPGLCDNLSFIYVSCDGATVEPEKANCSSETQHTFSVSK